MIIPSPSLVTLQVCRAMKSQSLIKVVIFVSKGGEKTLSCIKILTSNLTSWFDGYLHVNRKSKINEEKISQPNWDCWFWHLAVKKRLFLRYKFMLIPFSNNKKINPLIEYMGNNISKTKDIMEGKSRVSKISSLYT